MVVLGLAAKSPSLRPPPASAGEEGGEAGGEGGDEVGGDGN